MGCPHKIKVRAGPHVPPAPRRPGPAPDSWGGQGRAATLFACGAGTLRRGIARGSRMLSRPAQLVRPRPVPEAKPSKTPEITLFTTSNIHERTHNHPTPRPPTDGRARHSVRAALDIQADKLSPTAAIPMLHP